MAPAGWLSPRALAAILSSGIPTDAPSQCLSIRDAAASLRDHTSTLGGQPPAVARKQGLIAY